MDHLHSKSSFVLTALLVAVGCSSSGSGAPSDSVAPGGASNGGRGGASAGSTATSAGAGGAFAGAGGTSGGGAAGSAGTGGASGGMAGSGGAPAVGNCSPPEDIYNPIATLSLTGCVDPNDPTKLTARAVPYEVNSPLWSDGADKTRAFVLPAGQKIHVDSATGKWTFPVGSVMIKNFLFDGKFVETRLFMHVDDMTWVGYGYKWNGQGSAKQTDATIVGIGRDEVMFDTGKRTIDWNYPSRQDCMDCHNAVAGNTLGPSSAQMFRVATGHTKNQFDEFQTMGLFDAAPTAPTTDQVLVAPYTTQLGSPPASATLDQKARSYLQANCSHCHQPNDGFVQSPFPNFDLRYQTALKDSNICNVATTQGTVTGSNASKILVPGSPMDSVMWVRMNEPYTDQNTSGRMPQIGTHVIDAQGVQLIGDWITSLKSCP